MAELSSTKKNIKQGLNNAKYDKGEIGKAKFDQKLRSDHPYLKRKNICFNTCLTMWDIYLNFSSAERNIEEVLENAKSDQNFWKEN